MTTMLVLMGASMIMTGAAEADVPSLHVGRYSQEVAEMYGMAEGLPSEEVYAVEILEGNPYRVVAATSKGLAEFADGKWTLATQPEGLADASITHMQALERQYLCGVAGGKIWSSDANPIATVPGGAEVTCIAVSDMRMLLGTNRGLYEVDPPAGRVKPLEEFNKLLGEDKTILDIAWCPGLTVATRSGLFREVARDEDLPGPWTRLLPGDGQRRWAVEDVRAVTWSPKTGAWFAAPQGVGGRNGANGAWNLFTGYEGLPYNDFTSAACSPDGSVWFGTTKGAIHYDGQHWAYRQGRRWLPHDHVRDIAIAPNGDAWFATPKGVGAIRLKRMTLAGKAEFYEDEIDKYHRRTEYGYVLETSLEAPGDKSKWSNHDSDNDGLWTAMYGAGECFAYAATKSPEAKKRAKDAFEALRFLSVVTQGGDPPALPGFVARSILPTSGPNPNETEYTREKDIQKQKSDGYWKVMHPRWPTSADGKWYWKCDTSSDELDGHYFFYAVYYDLVADTDEEKQRVRDVVTGLTDHLVEHDFNLVDWDGEITRWAVFGPEFVNRDPSWFPERGLNSLSMLSYLSTAHHISGDQKYLDAFNSLVENHGYLMNLMYPKLQFGPGSNNQSDDEMAFMSYYNLMRYAVDEKVRAAVGVSFMQYWVLEQPELNPFFNFVYAAVCSGRTFTDPWGTRDLTPQGAWLEESVDTLKRFPLDRFNWGLQNSHRLDIVPLAPFTREGDDAQGKGHRRNGLVLPVDERHFNHWNTDPWALDYGGNGHTLSDGAVFLLPYYMGLYHGFIIEE